MVTKSTKFSPSITWLTARAVWCSMLCMHTFWFARSFTVLQLDPGSQVMLGLAIVFFLLKSADVAFLRVRWTRRSLIAAGMVVLMLHAGALDQWASGGSDFSFLWLPVAAVSAASLIGFATASAFSRKWAHTLAAIFDGKVLALRPLRHLIASLARWLQHLHFSITQAPSRAPPA